MSGAAFVEVATIATDEVVQAPLDMWAGFDGLGFDGKLFMSVGGHVTDDAHGGAIYSHDDRRGDAHWIQEFAENHFETAAKLRDWTNAAGLRRLYCWMETPDADESSLMYRELGAAIWQFDTGVPSGSNIVGGRGIGVSYYGEKDLFHGQGEDSSGSISECVVRRKNRTTGVWSEHRRIAFADGLKTMRELEWDDEGEGRLWEFFTGWPEGEGANARLFVDGVEMNAPADGVRQACWFPPSSKLFVAMRGPSHNIRRGDEPGPVWEIVHSFTGLASHVLYVPRGVGELWAVGQDPLEVVYSATGATGEWTAATGIPALTNSPGGTANAAINHNTSVGYYGGRVWIAARDHPNSVIRIYREAIASSIAAGQMLQVI